MGQVRYYQFLNSDSQVKQIRFHVVSITGEVEFTAHRKNPTNN